MDCSPPGSPVHGILQAEIPEWVAVFSFRTLPRYLSPIRRFLLWARPCAAGQRTREMKQLSCGAPSLWSQVSGTQNCSGLQSSWEGRQWPECPCRPLSKLGWEGKESIFEVGSNEVRGKAEAGETGGVMGSSGGVARRVGRREGGPPLFAFMKGNADTKKKKRKISTFLGPYLGQKISVWVLARMGSGSQSD